MTSYSRKNLLLGETKRGNKIVIDQKTRSTHMHIIGSTGEGKSKFMEHLIREDINANNGLCLIDPHGSLYSEIICWAETHHLLDRKKIILFDPSEENWSFAFNPLEVKGTEIAYHVDAMVKAVAKVWGGEDTNKTPLLKRGLKNLFHVLAEKKLSLLEAGELLNATDGTVRKFLTQDIQNSYIQDDWQYLNTLKPKPFRDEFGSTINRMMEFLSSPIIRNTIGQNQNTIDFRKIMDEGYILLVNLNTASRVSEDNARLLGTLIVNDLFMQAKGRPEGNRPFYLYIDECSLFVNEDIGRILAEGRKFGLHLILAHQHLAQLRKAGEEVYHSVMTNAKTKVVFGGLNVEDAQIMAETIHLGEHNLEEGKRSLRKPGVVGYEKVHLRNHSEGSSNSRGGGESFNSGYSSTENESYGETSSKYDEDRGSTSKGRGSSRSYSNSRGENSNWSKTTSASDGWSESYIPILEEQETQVYSLEEQIYKSKASMVNQPSRHAIIKIPKKHTERIITPEIKAGCARAERVQEFKEKSFRLTYYAQPRAITEREINQRKATLREMAQGQNSTNTNQTDDDDFIG